MTRWQSLGLVPGMPDSRKVRRVLLHTTSMNPLIRGFPYSDFTCQHPDVVRRLEFTATVRMTAENQEL